MTNEQKAWIDAFIGNRGFDEIEKAIVKALADAGRTSHGREWYTPTAIAVRCCQWSARAANSVGSAEGAVLFSLFYGLIDVFGFSGTMRVALAMLRKGKKHAGA